MIKKKRAQLEARDVLFEEKEFDFQRKQVARIDLFSIQVLQKLTINELADKWDQLEGDYLFLKWKLAMFISDKFKSKIEFGQFLQELRIANPNHTLCTIKQATFYRYARAARFCEKHKINDLKEIGISPTAIYDLSEIANEDVVDDDFISNIKNKNLPVAEIKRLIYQAHSITGEIVPEQSFELLEGASKETQVIEIQAEQPINSQPEMIYDEPANQITEEKMVEEILSLLDSFNLSVTEKLNVIKMAEKKISEMEYGS